MTTDSSPALLAQAQALMNQRPELTPLEALLLAVLMDRSAINERQDTGRISRQLDVEHALVRRAAASLEAKGWLTSTSKSGKSPGLKLMLKDSPPA
ncbi:hypothetical protein BFW38_14435 [Terasakiispira papahanaumokuakeensis]|uniref:HTH marR-type domain-containing protein n=1 Tax=Terasakiispira papahanaumokuakeensis TaxID=197479 RepID=A0A1E2VC08_9GAMM|nr:MarR family transcriptional regulator [Terasakiispira papahanaumokuakeensis]ODC04548.1 hypothetical protein BFW38_14435 [Terasakiispira papahanaumokuakeensis]